MLTTLSQGARGEGRIIANRVSADRLASNLLSTKVGGDLEAFFAPRNVAVIGATDKAGSAGRTILWNLISNPFGGTVFPVNPKRPRVLGIKAHPRIGDVPDPIDLAIVATPAPTVPDLIAECVEAGVRAAIVTSPGFREIGREGAQLERQILEQALRKAGGNKTAAAGMLGLKRTTLSAKLRSLEAGAGQG